MKSNVTSQSSESSKLGLGHAWSVRIIETIPWSHKACLRKEVQSKSQAEGIFLKGATTLLPTTCPTCLLNTSTCYQNRPVPVHSLMESSRLSTTQTINAPVGLQANPCIGNPHLKTGKSWNNHKIILPERWASWWQVTRTCTTVP